MVNTLSPATSIQMTGRKSGGYPLAHVVERDRLFQRYVLVSSDKFFSRQVGIHHLSPDHSPRSVPN